MLDFVTKNRTVFEWSGYMSVFVFVFIVQLNISKEDAQSVCSCVSRIHSDTLPPDNAPKLKIIDFVCETRTILHTLYKYRLPKGYTLTTVWFIQPAIITTANESQFSKINTKS